MFIIFGWKKTTKPLESLLTTDCHRCHNRSKWNIRQETEWVSLFFIRLFPFKNKYRLACEICGDSVLLAEKTCQQIRNHQKHSQAKNQQVYNRLIQQVEDHQFAGMTQGQRQYYRGVKAQGN